MNKPFSIFDPIDLLMLLLLIFLLVIIGRYFGASANLYVPLCGILWPYILIGIIRNQSFGYYISSLLGKK